MKAVGLSERTQSIQWVFLIKFQHVEVFFWGVSTPKQHLKVKYPTPPEKKKANPFPISSMGLVYLPT